MKRLLKNLFLTGCSIQIALTAAAQPVPAAVQRHISEAETYFFRQNYGAALTAFQRALTASNAGRSFATSASICLDMATVSSVSEDVPKALRYTRQALTYFNQAGQRTALLRFKVELSFATYYQKSILTDSAGMHFRQCEQLIRLHHDLDENDVQTYLTKYAEFTFDLLAYHEAIRLNQKALLMVNADDILNKATAYNNLGRCYVKLNQFALADSAFRQAFVRYKGNLSYQAIVLNNLADSQLRQGHLTDAAATLQTARQLYRRYSQQTGAQRDVFTEQRLSANTAELLFRQKQWAESERESHRLIALCRAYFPMPTPALVENYLRLSALHRHAGRWSDALTATQQAVAEATGPDRTTTENAVLPRSLLTALTAQGQLLRSMPAADTTTRIARDEAAFSAYEQAIRLATSVRRGVVFTNSKTFLAAHTADLFDPALELAFTLSRRSRRPAFYRDRAFYLVELARNALLTDAQAEQRLARRYLPPALRTALQQQQQALSQLALLRETTRDTATAGRISAQVASHESQLLAVQQRIERSYPAYAQAKRQLTDWSLSALQRRLANGEVLISYAPLPTELLILACSRTNSTIRRVAVPQTVLLHAADRFRAEVSRNPGRVGSYDPNPARRLYDYLLRPLEADLLRNATALTILPPPDLLLPFEALAPRPNAFLVQDYEVGYQYNLTRLYTPNVRPDSAPAEPLVMAPFTGESKVDSVPVLSRWKSLPASRRETDVFGGTALRDGQATKRAFLRSAPTTNLIVCATHTVSGPSETGLVFWPGEKDYVLYPSQVQHLDLQRVELVTLSACATERGVSLPGDGVQSLGRAFAWAGAGAVTCSLFPLDDAAQGMLAESFYRNLSTRQSIRQTLRAAKLAYLNSDEGYQTGQHPFYWAGLIVYGGQDAPTFGSGRWVTALWTLPLLLTVGSAGWWFMRRKRAARAGAPAA